MYFDFDLNIDDNAEIVLVEEPLSPQSDLSELKIFESTKTSLLKLKFISLDSSSIEDFNLEFNNTAYLKDIKIYLEIKLNIIIREIIFNSCKFSKNFTIYINNLIESENIVKIYYKNLIDNIEEPCDLITTDNTEYNSDQNDLIADSIINFYDEISNIINTGEIDLNNDLNSLTEIIENRINSNYTINLDENDILLFNDLFENHYRENKKKLSKKELNNFEILKYKDRKEVINSEFCAICCDKFENDNIIRVLKCKHYFHDNCIDKWLVEFENNCPICKKIF